MIVQDKYSRLALDARKAARVTGPRRAVRRRPATRKSTGRSPLREIVDRVERSRRERIVGALASVGVGFLLLASLLPAACGAMQL